MALYSYQCSVLCRAFLITYYNKSDVPLAIADDWDLDAALQQCTHSLKLSVHCSFHFDGKLILTTAIDHNCVAWNLLDQTIWDFKLSKWVDRINDLYWIIIIITDVELKLMTVCRVQFPQVPTIIMMN